MSRKRWILCFSVFIIVLLFQSIASAKEANVVDLQTATSELEVGDMVTVTVEGAGLTNLYASDVRLIYDATRLQFVDAVSELGGGFLIKKQEGNTLILAHTLMNDVPGISGDVRLYAVTFQVIAEGKAEVSLAEVTRVVIQGGELFTEAGTIGQGVSLRISSQNGEDPGEDPDEDSNGNSGDEQGDGSVDEGESADQEPSEEPDTSQELSPTVEIEQIVVEGVLTTMVTVDREAWFAALEALAASDDGQGELTITIPGGTNASVLLLEAHTLLDIARNNPEVMLIIQSEFAAYHLPLKLFDSAFLTGLENEWAELTIEIHIGHLTESELEQAQDVLNQYGLKTLISPVEFRIIVVTPGGVLPINDFGSEYVERTFLLPDDVDIELATAVEIDMETGKIRFVPAVFTMADGAVVVTMKRNSNSIYTVVEGSRSFTDLDQHWSQGTVEMLAAKQLISGVSDTKFAPDVPITRAEFTALIVRALGLKAHGGQESAGNHIIFSDVRMNDWFASEVETAYHYGLAGGIGQGLFAPNESITREAMAVLLARAQAFTGVAIQPMPSAPRLTSFQDSDLVSQWAAPALEHMLQTGIIRGRSEDRVAPKDPATRAEAAVMLGRLLQAIEFMN